MDLQRWLRSPVASLGVYLPVGTLAVFAAGDALGVFAFGNAVLAVTFLTAIGWVVVGFSGSRIEGPFDVAIETDRDRVSRSPGESNATGDGNATDNGNVTTDEDSNGIPRSAGTLGYLTVTTALGWAVLLLLY